MGALETWDCRVVTLEPSLELGLSPATLVLCSFSPVAQPLWTSSFLTEETSSFLFCKTEAIGFFWVLEPY